MTINSISLFLLLLVAFLSRRTSLIVSGESFSNNSSSVIGVSFELALPVAVLLEALPEFAFDEINVDVIEGILSSSTSKQMNTFELVFNRQKGLYMFYFFVSSKELYNIVCAKEVKYTTTTTKVIQREKEKKT